MASSFSWCESHGLWNFGLTVRKSVCEKAGKDEKFTENMLKQRILEWWEQISVEEVRRAVKSWKKRLMLCYSIACGKHWLLFVKIENNLKLFMAIKWNFVTIRFLLAHQQNAPQSSITWCSCSISIAATAYYDIFFEDIQFSARCNFCPTKARRIKFFTHIKIR